MKKSVLSYLMLAWCGLVGTHVAQATQLNGAYTINPGSSATTTNFQNFASAITYMTSTGSRSDGGPANSGTVGVSGPVVFQVAAATYSLGTTGINIPAITGTSATNTVTFDGGAGNAATRIITGNIQNGGATFALNGCQYVTLRNLSIINTATQYAGGVTIVGSSTSNTGSYNSIKSCIITLTNGGGSSGYGTPITLNYSNYSMAYSYSTTYCSNIEIDSNVLNNGYYGIGMYGASSTSQNANIKIRNNTINNIYYMGIYFYYIYNSFDILNNNITMQPTSGTNPYVMYLYYCLNSSSNPQRISGNRLRNCGYTGIYYYSQGPTAAPTEFYNNMIAGGFNYSSTVYGIVSSYSSSSAERYYHNTIWLDNPYTSTGYGLQTSASNLVAKNNIFMVTGPSTSSYPAYFGNTVSGNNINYNEYFNQNGTYLLYRSGTWTSANYRTATAGGDSSFNQNILNGFFKDMPNGDLHLADGCVSMNGVDLTAIVPTDYDGQTRTTPTSIGCDIFSQGTNDVSVAGTDLIPPLNGTYSVKVRFKNAGTATLYTSTFVLKVNGTTVSTYYYSGSGLASCASDSITFSTSYTFNPRVPYNVLVYSEAPNSSADDNPSSDTIKVNFYGALDPGTYTINPVGAGTTNFTSFTEVNDVLNNGGIIGPVLFNVAPGTFSERVSLVDVKGVNATNTIEFNGGSASTTELEYGQTSNSNAHTFQVKNTPYVTVRNLTIRSTGTYGVGVHITGSSSYTKVKNCIIEFTGPAQSSTNSYYTGIAMNNSSDAGNMFNGNVRLDSCEIDSNTIRYGYAGIIFYGQTNTPYSVNNKFRNNTLDSVWYYGTYFYYMNGVEISGNKVNMRSGNVNALSMYNQIIATSNPNTIIIHNNKIFGYGQYGMYLYLTTTSLSNRVKVTNNVVSGARNNNSYGMYVIYPYNSDFYHNTVVNEMLLTGTYAAVYFNTASSTNIKNNYFICTNPNVGAQAVYLASMNGQLNYNNYYMGNPSAPLLYIGGVYYTRSNFVGGGGYNQNSFNKYVPFTLGTRDLHITDGCAINGDSSIVSALPLDYDGITRGVYPDMGAYEVSASSNDVGVDSLISPNFPLASGTQTLSARIKNMGNNTVYSCNVSVSINGGTPQVYNYSGTLDPCQTANITFGTSYTFNPGVSYSIKVYTDNPNSSADNVRSNDTMITSMCVAMSGNYTINPAGSGGTNYTSFNAAINALACGGVSGPVVFDVAPGTYTEQVTFGGINGISAANVVTFQSATGNAADVTLQYAPATPNDNWTVRFFYSQYIKLKALTLRSNGNTNSYTTVVYLAGGNMYDTVEACRIIAPVSTTTGTNCALVYMNNTIESYNVFLNDSLYNGSFAYYLYSNTSSTTVRSVRNVIKGNYISNPYYYGMYLYYFHDSIKVQNNTLIMNTPYTGTSYGIYSYYNFNRTDISGNKIFMRSAGGSLYGIYHQQQSNNGDSAFIRNNFITVGGGATTAYGLYVASGVTLSRYYNNTINVLQGSATTSYAAYFATTGSNNRAVNNIFTNQNTVANAFALYVNNQSYTASNYNNLFTRGTNLASNGTSYTTFTAWRASAGTPDLMSQNSAVDYVNATDNDLHHSSPCFVGAGANLSSIMTTDIDGNARPAGPATIGATEYTAAAYDAQVLAITAPTVYSASAQNVTFRVANKGTTTITSIDMSYRVNNNSPVFENFYNLNILPCRDTVLTFLNQVSLPTGSSGLKVFVSGYINTTNNDANNLNDTVGQFYCSVMGGTYTINKNASVSSTNFQSFAAAISAITSCGVNAPVVFNVVPGTYTEQVAIGTTAIAGVSATNTISFNGSDSGTCILTATGNSTNYYTLRINGSGGKFITFRNLHIENTSPQYGFGVQLFSTSSATPVNNIRFVRCTIKTQNVNSSSTVAPVVMSGSTTSPTSTGGYFNTITIDSCNLHGGYYGVTSFGYTSTPYANNVAIRSCNITGQYLYAIYTSYTSNLTITDNRIFDIGAIFNYTSPRAMYLINSSSPSTGSVISRNTIYGSQGGYGIFTQNFSGTAASHVVISNNMVSIGNGAANTSVGLYNSSGGSYYDVIYNNVNINSSASSTGSCAIYYSTAPTNTVVLNNNFRINNTTNGYIMYFQPSSSSYFTNVNYNNYFGGAYYNGQTSLASYKNSMGFANDTNSISVDPGYVSGTDLHINNTVALNGAATPFAGITTDFDGQTRNTTTPDIGADEFSPPTGDLQAVSILKPANPLIAGAQDVWVVFKNAGLGTITSARVSYRVNTSAAVSLTWTGSLTSGAQDTAKFTGSRQFNFAAGTSFIKAYTDSPNTVADPNLLNDTVTLTVCSGLSGAYTINPAGSGGSNFTSFTAAVTALNCGITGPITFNVAPGTYTEQIVIPPVAGASATNKVTFQSATGNAADVALQFNSSASNNYVVRLNGADYVTLNKLSLISLNTTYARVVELRSVGADHATNNSITNCNIMLSTYVGTTSNNAALLVSDQNSYNPINTMIRGNTFNNGAYAIYINGNTTTYTTGLVIDSNTVNTGVYYMAMYVYYCDAPRITRNTINGNPNYTNYYGIYTYFNTNDGIISRNVIQVPNGGWGIQSYYTNSSGQAPATQIANNAISVGGSNGAPTYGIQFMYGGNTDILNNSIYLFGAGGYSSTPAPACISTYGQGVGSYNNKVTILNNNLYTATSGAYTLYVGGSSQQNAVALIDTCNYNNYAGTVTDLFNIYGNIYTTLPSFRNQIYTGNDLNSYSSNPAFTSPFNLRPNPNSTNSWVANGNGIQLPGRVTTDINGILRSVSVSGGGVDIGAYEFRPVSLPPVAVASPASPAASTTQTFSVYGNPVASITWGASGTVPSAVTLRYYPGANPPDSTNCGTVPNARYMNAYWNISATGGSGFTYNTTLNYQEHLLGTVQSESNLRMAKKDAPCAWNYYPSSTVNAGSNTVTYNGLTGFSDFTGTDNSNPLPVKLNSFTAKRNGNVIILSWSTLFELNTSHFEVERSIGSTIGFVSIGKVKAAGNSNTLLNYLMQDIEAMMLMGSKGTAYYRLKIADANGAYEYSDIALITASGETVISVTPNPFESKLNLDLVLNVSSPVELEMSDINGRVIGRQRFEGKAGANHFTLTEYAQLGAGIYFVRIYAAGETSVMKIVKQ